MKESKGFEKEKYDEKKNSMNAPKDWWAKEWKICDVCAMRVCLALYA